MIPSIYTLDPNKFWYELYSCSILSSFDAWHPQGVVNEFLSPDDGVSRCRWETFSDVETDHRRRHWHWTLNGFAAQSLPTFVEHPLKTLRASPEGVSKKLPDEAEYELPHID
jgi:hypothetical protein